MRKRSRRARGKKDNDKKELIGKRRWWTKGLEQKEEDKDLLVEAATTVFIVCIDEHLEGVVLDVGVAHHLLGD